MFTNKLVVVTGAAQGIGKSIAGHFTEKGAKVIGLDIEEVKIEGVEFMQCDGFLQIKEGYC